MRISADRLREAMNKKGLWNNTKLASACNLSRGTVSSILNGRYKSDLRDETIMQICNALDVSPEFLSGKNSFPEGLTKEEQARRALFDLLTAAGNIEPIPDGRFRLSGPAGCVEMSETEMQSLIAHFQRRLDSMCNEYIELCAVHDRGQKSK